MEETADRLLLAENMKVLVAQSCLSLCDPVEILQARILEWLPCPPPGDPSGIFPTQGQIEFSPTAGRFVTI